MASQANEPPGSTVRPRSAVILSLPTHTASFPPWWEGAWQLPEKTGAPASPGTHRGIKCNGPGFQSTLLKIPSSATVQYNRHHRLSSVDTASSWDGQAADPDFIEIFLCFPFLPSSFWSTSALPRYNDETFTIKAGMILTVMDIYVYGCMDASFISPQVDFHSVLILRSFQGASAE